nr:FMN-binding protein [Rhodoblastus acidophilus]
MANGDVVPAGEGDPPTGAVRFYAAYDANGHLDGVAAEGAAKGYADTVRVMFGYRKACQCIVGFGVVSMRETPGIGDKIITDKDFLANFKALDVKLTEDLAGLANEVKVVKHGTKAQGWQIDAISGSTVTSRAVGKGINDAAQILLPRLVPKIDRLEKQ